MEFRILRSAVRQLAVLSFFPKLCVTSLLPTLQQFSHNCETIVSNCGSHQSPQLWIAPSIQLRINRRSNFGSTLTKSGEAIVSRLWIHRTPTVQHLQRLPPENSSSQQLCLELIVLQQWTLSFPTAGIWLILVTFEAACSSFPYCCWTVLPFFCLSPVCAICSVEFQIRLYSSNFRQLLTNWKVDSWT